MTDQAIQRRINAWRNDARCTEVLTLGRLPTQPQPTDQGPAPADDHQGPPADQPAPSTGGTGGASASGATGGVTQDQPSQPTEEELARDAIGQKVLDATMNCTATEVDHPSMTA